MFSIKKDVDLKELEKLGFEYEFSNFHNYGVYTRKYVPFFKHDRDKDYSIHIFDDRTMSAVANFHPDVFSNNEYGGMETGIEVKRRWIKDLIKSRLVDKETTKTFISFKSKNQLPLIMIIRAYYKTKADRKADKEYFAEVLYSSQK